VVHVRQGVAFIFKEQYAKKKIAIHQFCPGQALKGEKMDNKYHVSDGKKSLENCHRQLMRERLIHCLRKTRERKKTMIPANTKTMMTDI